MGWLPMEASSLVSLSDWQKFLTCQQTGVFAWFPCRSFFQAIVIRSRLIAKAHCAYMILPYGVEILVSLFLKQQIAIFDLSYLVIWSIDFMSSAYKSIFFLTQMNGKAECRVPIKTRLNAPYAQSEVWGPFQSNFYFPHGTRS